MNRAVVDACLCCVSECLRVLGYELREAAVLQFHEPSGHPLV